jgi:replication factor A1
MSEINRPKCLTKHAVKTIVETEDVASIQTLKPILQVLTVKDVRNKKNMKDKLTVSDGVNKVICIIKEKINSKPEQAYKVLDIIRLNKFAVKVVGKVKVIIPSNDIDILSHDVEEMVGKPKDYVPGDDMDMDFEPEITYKQVKEEDAEIEDQISDVEMKATPVKVEEDKEELPDATPSPAMKSEMEDVEDDIYTPIKALSPMNSDWIIKARVSKKYPVKEWNNSRGSGKLMNFELVDKHGTQIQATLFNKAVEKFEPIIQQDKVYVFCKGQVKVANQKFTAIKNDYSLTFNPYSEITQTEDDSSISKMAFNFVTLKEIQNKREGKTLDFVGIVLSNTGVTTINLKNGGTKDKRDYEVCDNSEDGGLKAVITLWGKGSAKTFAPGTCVAFKGLRVTNFKGLTLNGGDYTGVEDGTSLKLKEASKLTQWYRQIKGSTESMRSLTESPDGDSKKSNTSNVRLIGEVQENAQSDLVNDPNTRYYVNANVEMIKNDPNMVYMACPSCKKKMVEEDGMSMWRCERCDMTTNEPVATYILSCKIADSTGSMWVRVYGDAALPIMNQMTADKFREYLQMGEEVRENEVKEQLSRNTFGEYSFMIKPSVSEYNGQTSMSYFASKVYDYSYKKSSDFLMSRLQAYKDKPEIAA